MISICIATYNRKDYLKQALESAFRQTFKDFEVVVLDDGSTDGTEEMVARLGFPIRYYKQANHGQPQTYNRLAQLARGEYLCFLDSDDILLDDALERLVAARKGARDKIAYGSYIRIDERGCEIGRDSKTLYSGDITGKLFQTIFVHCVSTLFPKTIFFEKGGYDTALKVCFDLDLHLRTSLDYEYVAADGPTFRRRRHSTNMSAYNYRNHMAELGILENFYFNKDGWRKIKKSEAMSRLARQACRAGKCAIKERNYVKAREILSRSLSYKTSLKALLLLCRLAFQQRFSRSV